ncbi:uncharacterized protein LOC142564453 [Dermacentor variabilis]|uniref:uncharacterized protein LOC142564453 n=1 Tax=Dermacentor variabilis TaxID=34621 RepID=UPI003F5CA7F3
MSLSTTRTVTDRSPSPVRYRWHIAHRPVLLRDPNVCYTVRCSVCHPPNVPQEMALSTTRTVADCLLHSLADGVLLADGNVLFARHCCCQFPLAVHEKRRSSQCCQKKA